MESDAVRKRLTRSFEAVIAGSQQVQNVSAARLFIRALCAQTDAAAAMGRLISSPNGLDAVQSSLRVDISAQFMNRDVQEFFRWLQDPVLKFLCNGEFLSQVVECIADPPIFLDAFVQAFKEARLEPPMEQCFAWLLLELSQVSPKYLVLARDTAIQNRLEKSTDPDVGRLYQLIKRVTVSSDPLFGEDGAVTGPGGRHDNDFADFRQVKVLPTAAELISKEPPFLHRASELDTPDVSDEKRLPLYLGHQFRLLREDMLGEMRDEINIIRGQKKGRHRGVVLRGFEPIGVHSGVDRQITPWCLKLQMLEDPPFLKGAKDRAKFWKAEKNKRILQHNSLVCLLVDGDVIAFPSVFRNEEQLCQKPPVVLLQFTEAESAKVALLRFKTVKDNITLVQIDTPVFAYEPILHRLQKMTHLELDELFAWEEDDLPSELDRSSPLRNAWAYIRKGPQHDLQSLLGTPTSVKLDDSQSTSLLTSLKQRVSLIQGPPGTGKSFIGALLAKTIYEFTDQKILVVCYTNHALDQFLEDLMDIGIPQDNMVRLGGTGKARPRAAAVSLFQMSRGNKRSQKQWKLHDESKARCTNLRPQLDARFASYLNYLPAYDELLDYLECDFENMGFVEAFEVPPNEDNMQRVGRKNKVVGRTFLLGRWINGQDSGFLTDKMVLYPDIWHMPLAQRQAIAASWYTAIMGDTVDATYGMLERYETAQSNFNRLQKEADLEIMRGKRIIGCTTTGAAKYVREVHAAGPQVLLVEEAGEILESHIVTAMNPQTEHLILIGDHKQLRPKINNYNLTVEKGDGFDLNRSLFERLVLKGFPHTTLASQHRMRPEISDLVRQLTYPNLKDAPSTLGRSDLRGFRSNVVFVNHKHPEEDENRIADHGIMGASTSSKRNRFEARMVLKVVKYLGQQDYRTDEIVVLTPYLGQLQLLREVLGEENDPVLNDLDNAELVRAGLISPATAALTKNKIRIATIDNYQGEESDIVIVTLTRSNKNNDIGFMSQPERLNVLLSRARNALLLIGNADNFRNAKKGRDIWIKFFELLTKGGYIHEGFPVKCAAHPDRKTLLTHPDDFESQCPDGGCTEPCGSSLSCGVHKCPRSCHRLADHSMMPCDILMSYQCTRGHPKKYHCNRGPPLKCNACDREDKIIAEKAQREFDRQQKREAELRKHQEEMAKLDEEIERERQILKQAHEEQERERALEQRRKDLEDAKAINASRSSFTAVLSAVFGAFGRGENPASTEDQTAPTTTNTNAKSPAKRQSAPTPGAGKPFPRYESAMEKEWVRRKELENAQSTAIDELMAMIGLEDVKEQILGVRDNFETSQRQGLEMTDVRLNSVLLGNPGTGKTTVARLYARILAELGLLPGTMFVETTGARLANGGTNEVKKHIEDIHKANGGTLFIDEAYQLTSGNSYGGGGVLDFLLAEMENNVGKIIFILAGYNKEMESFFKHNPGITSRVPIEMQFADYNDTELLEILRRTIVKKYKGKMEIEGGENGLYVRIFIRRLARGRGRNGFGNARALQNAFAIVTKRQSKRLRDERRNGLQPDDFFLTKEDLIGPDPSDVQSEARKRLNEMIGLDSVKLAVDTLFDQLEQNYKRELAEKPPLEVSLNRVFLGSPGTGKTSVAKLYGQILADLGMLSNGEVVIKNPSDFVGSVIGESEKNTSAILASTVGKVLIIDEAYMLYSGANGVNQSDPYRTAVVDTLVAEIQSVPGDDRCVLLLGYDEQMNEMFQNVNPGLQRRFALDSAFHFQDFTQAELGLILDLKLKQQGLDATESAKTVALDVLGRARRRPNFGNGGEIENLLGKAKSLYLARDSKKPPRERSVDIVFEPQDFDPDHDRGSSASVNCKKLFEDVIGCEEIVKKLEGYQKIATKMKELGQDPHSEIPTNFIFKGPPGTGKTTTARKMGQVFYDMGFLGSAEVIECSASDLIAPYVGQTGGKVRKQFDQALGKVLFIDEAYRLADGGFAADAVNEIVDLLTKDKYKSKMIVILAGYVQDINRLMSVNSGLSSRFPEEIHFENMSAPHCIQLIVKTLRRKGIACPELEQPNSSEYFEICELLAQCAQLPSWGNGRDVETISKKLIGHAFSKDGGIDLTGAETLHIMREWYAERKERGDNVGPTSSDPFSSGRFQLAPPTPQAPPKTSTIAATRTKNKTPEPQQQPEEIQKPEKAAEDDQDPRDSGVSDSVWAQLQADKHAAAQAEERFAEELKHAAKEAQKAADAIKAHEKMLERLTQEKLQAKVEAERLALFKRLEKARIKEIEERARAERLRRELEKRKRAEIERKKREQAVQKRLRDIGICPAGFAWIKQAGGYRCSAGGHFVTDAQIGI